MFTLYCLLRLILPSRNRLAPGFAARTHDVQKHENRNPQRCKFHDGRDSHG
jgi:hypothetical protein